MSHKPQSNENGKELPKHECPICGDEVTIRDAFTRRECPGCESSLNEMQDAASK